MDNFKAIDIGYWNEGISYYVILNFIGLTNFHKLISESDEEIQINSIEEI